MAEPLKTFFSPKVIRLIAADIERVDSSFPSRAFIRQAEKGLDELELMDRGKQIARALGEHLAGGDYPRAVDVLLRSLSPEHPKKEVAGSNMAAFYYFPHTVFVAERGLGHFDVSLRAQYELTKRFTAEFSIRPFLAKDPERTFAYLEKWATDESAQVRRLVSEGTRLRLPWASRVAWLDANPERVLALLERLKNDPTPLVRRSVANNLNDLSKVNKELTLKTCRAWLRAPSENTTSLVRHALRSLVKQGDRGALELLGVGARPRVEVGAARFSAKRVRIGEQIRFSFSVQSTAARAQELAIDYAVHFVKANGTARPKVFKLKRLTLEANGSATLQGRVSLADLTTRRHYVGSHRVEVLVNGIAFPLGAFEVRA